MISADLIESLREHALGLLDAEILTEVVIYKRTRDTNLDNNPYGSSGESYVAGETHNGWFLQPKATPIDVQNTIIGSVATFEFRMIPGADVDTGDRVTIAGDWYTVTNTNREDTVQIFLHLTLVRLE